MHFSRTARSIVLCSTALTLTCCSAFAHIPFPKRSIAKPTSALNIQKRANQRTNYNRASWQSNASSASSSTSIMSSTSTTVSSSFGTLVPKEETNVPAFLKAHPEYNGKNVTIGILDTGCDVGAIGLQSLPGGTGTKLVDTHDCTGGNDVDVSEATAKWVEEGGVGWWEVEGLSGRTLKLNPDWNIGAFPAAVDEADDKVEKDEKEPEEETKDDKEKDNTKTVKVRLGIKRAYELYPSKTVLNRVKSERSKQFQSAQRVHAASLRAKLEAFTQKNTGDLTPALLKQKQDWEYQLELLELNEDKMKEWADPGPLYDCIVYYDEETKDYRGIVDTSETGDLTRKSSLAPFGTYQEYGTFGIVDRFNYALQIYDEGTVLSIVADAGAHGSHVAGIAAAHHPTNSLDDGVAPGARVVSLKIGDTRLGSMESMPGLYRALLLAIKLKLDVINLSYGESVHEVNRGKFVELANEMVLKHGITFVSSAGNNGPALTTVGAPGGSCEHILSIAAHVSKDMMGTLYSLKEEEDTDGATFTWSSVGPAMDGANGVTLTAPGGAVTCVPNWTLQRCMLMNGTSMSSPHAAGCVALLISACKANDIPINTVRIRKALEATATNLDNLNNLQQGRGMINVPAAWDYLLKNKDDINQDVLYKVTVGASPSPLRGVYLRQAHETSHKQSVAITVAPQFGYDDLGDDDQQQKRVEFEQRITLMSDANYVDVPEKLALMNNGRTFKIEIDPTNLPPGLHTTLIKGYPYPEDGNTNDGDAPPLFVMPITIAKPLPTTSPTATTVELGDLNFSTPHQIHRLFLTPPETATYADIFMEDTSNISADDDATPRLFTLHTVQLLPSTPHRDNEKQRTLNLYPKQSTITSLPVTGGVTMELCLARGWSTLKTPNAVNVKVVWGGVQPTPAQLSISSGMAGSKPVRLYNGLDTDVTLNPTAKLTKWKHPLRPKTIGTIQPLGERDILPSHNSRIYQLLTEYEYTPEKDDLSKEYKLTPRIPSLNHYLYESQYFAQMVHVYDDSKKLLGVTDSYPGEVTIPANSGTLTLRTQIRHEDPMALEKLNQQVVWVERTIGDVSLSVHNSHMSMVANVGTFSKRVLKPDQSTAAFVSAPNLEALGKIKGLQCGDVLEGSISYEAAKSGARGGASKRPGGYPISYVVGPKALEAKKDESKTEAEDERTEGEKLEEAVLKLKVSTLEKLIPKHSTNATQSAEEEEKFTKLYQAVSDGNEKHLPLLMVHLQKQDAETLREERLEEVIQASNAILGEIDETKLALYYGGTYHDKEDPESVKERKEMDELKGQLAEALGRKARALADMENKSSTNTTTITDSGEEKDEDKSTTTNLSKATDIDTFDDIVKHMRNWVDIDANLKFSVLTLERERRANHPGHVLKLLNKLLEKNGEDTKGGICHITKSDIYKRRTTVLEELNYDHLVERDRVLRVISSPKKYSLF